MNYRNSPEEYNLFVNIIADKLKVHEACKNVKIEINNCVRNNDIELKGICIRNENTNADPVFYMEGYFEDYKNGKINIDEICETIIAEQKRQERSFDLSKIFNESTKDNIIFSLVGKESNQEMLKNSLEVVEETN